MAFLQVFSLIKNLQEIEERVFTKFYELLIYSFFLYWNEDIITIKINKIKKTIIILENEIDLKTWLFLNKC